MRLHVCWVAEKTVVMPWNYMNLLHGFVYRAIKKADPVLGNFLHNRGFVVGGHRYKFLTFSLLFPRAARKADKGIEMRPPINWWVSSPLPGLMEALATTLLMEGKAQIGKVELILQRLEAEELPHLGRRSLFETISPIVTSTGVKQGGKIKRRFLSPEDPDFWRVLEVNLKRKAAALGWGSALGNVKFLCEGKWRSKLFEVQGANVRGWMGKFWCEGSSELLRLGYEAGFGERNAQGFGMVRILVPTVPSKPGDLTRTGDLRQDIQTSLTSEDGSSRYGLGFATRQ